MTICLNDGTAKMALNFFPFLGEIYALFLPKCESNHFRSSVNDKFSCFMMILNYPSGLCVLNSAD